MTSLGEVLRRARLAKGVTFEEAERVTRIPHRYLEALEQENFGILPAPVYARGFLRSYAGYLGLNPAELLPFFPVGHVEEPRLAPLPEVKQPRTWSASGVIAVAVVGLLILLVVALYSIGREESSGSLVGERLGASGQASPGIGSPRGQGPGEQSVGPALALPDLVGVSLEEAISIIRQTGASYVVVGIREGDIPAGQVIDQAPPAETLIRPGDLVTLVVSR